MEDGLRDGGMSHARKDTNEGINGCFNWATVV